MSGESPNETNKIKLITMKLCVASPVRSLFRQLELSELSALFLLNSFAVCENCSIFAASSDEMCKQ